MLSTHGEIHETTGEPQKQISPCDISDIQERVRRSFRKAVEVASLLGQLDLGISKNMGKPPNHQFL